MKVSSISRLTAYLLGVSVLTGLSAANATDNRLWREQVDNPVTGVILTVEKIGGETGLTTEYRFWREQVSSSAGGLELQVVSTRPTGEAPEFALWREQVKPRAKRGEKDALRVASPEGR